MTALDYVVAGSIDRNAAEPFEVGTVQWVRRPGDGERDALGAGFWFVSPDDAPKPMEVVGHADETVYIVEGRVRVQIADGEPADLTAGSVASFNKDVAAVWTVVEPTIEFFVYS
ncbi:cupin domain-containing protein [Microbacterium panaciterrae]|uniref:(S)-ureidoglycine aminohydrolase cupin domain-containing protein n=1 Tax=Microbacterium panaciterrae TaxID=985759 RepID=A0ABP8PRE0_9MICO